MDRGEELRAQLRALREGVRLIFRGAAESRCTGTEARAYLKSVGPELKNLVEEIDRWERDH